MTEESIPKIRLAGVGKSFGDHRVLDDVDLTVAAGRNSVLIGAAATGKSVLLRCILGLYIPDEGRIEIDGVDTTDLTGDDRIELLERFGVLFQLSALFDSLPVWENITFKLMNVNGLARRAARELAVEKLGQVGLTPDVADLSPADLSGGMQKRVALARAVAGEPEILILDDPTAGLDPIMAHAINRLVNRLVGEMGATALSVTGDMDAVREYYDDATMINDGKIVWKGPTSTIDRADSDYLRQLTNGDAKGPIQMRLRHR